MKRGKCIIISAPSGTGKSTIIGWLMQAHPELRLAFSISCTSRPPRGSEQHGVEYFFLTPEEFRRRIDNDEFLEYEEVYENRLHRLMNCVVAWSIGPPMPQRSSTSASPVLSSSSPLPRSSTASSSTTAWNRPRATPWPSSPTI